MSGKVYLVAGSTGAGKTTYARQLTDRVGAVRFSIDEWMTALFWQDAADPIDPAWVMERIERCYSQIWAVAEKIAQRDVPVVLDLGFTTRDSRARFADLARASGSSPSLRFVDVPAAERWRRVERRNRDIGECSQLRFAVTREMFDYVEGLWQPPSVDELDSCDGQRIAAARDLAFDAAPR